MVKLGARFFSRRTLLADRFLYATPDGLGLEAEEVEFRSGGIRLRGWFLPGEKVGTVVFCPGNSANVSCHLEYVRIIRDAGYSVLCFDYRGFGRSEGVADLRGVVDDVRAAFLAARDIAGDGVPVALFGLSLGANAVVAAAASAEGGPRPDALIVEGLSDLEDMLVGLFARRSFGPLRIQEIIHPDGTAYARDAVRIGAFAVPRWVARVLARLAAGTYPFVGRRPRRFARELAGVPTFIVHGVDDSLLPFEAAVDLRKALGDAATLWLVPGTGHAQEPAMSLRVEYAAQLSSFLAAAFGGAKADIPLRREETRSGGATFLVEPPEDCRRALVTVAGPSRLLQRVVEGPGPVRVEFPGPYDVASALPSTTLDVDGWPRPDLDPLSTVYRDEGYRGAFRRIVRAVNSMDVVGIDAGLTDYLSLKRRFPFDFFAAVYCLRVAVIARHGQPGWPAVPREIAERCLERFLALWHAHEGLPDETVRASPAAWVRRAVTEVP